MMAGRPESAGRFPSARESVKLLPKRRKGGAPVRSIPLVLILAAALYLVDELAGPAMGVLLT